VLDRSALANMYLAFEADDNIGGVCGFMGIKLQDVYTDGGLRSKFDIEHVFIRPK